jgi:hypothetical protein
MTSNWLSRAQRELLDRYDEQGVWLSDRTLVTIKGEMITVKDAEPMSKADIIRRRMEAIEMRYPLIWVGSGPPLWGCCM